MRVLPPKLSQILGTLLLTAGLGVATDALARSYVGYTGKPWVNDYGVLFGECKAAQIAQLLKAGAFDQMALVDNDVNWQALLPSGTTEPARRIDSHCFAHTLELVPSGQAVRWLNPVSGNGLYIYPGPKSDTCRSYLGVLAVNGQKNKFRGEACVISPGVWRIQP